MWSCFAVVGDWLPDDVRLKKTVGRMATYLQAYGDLMVRTNDWDPAVLERFRADPFVAGFRGALDSKATTERTGTRRDAHPRRVAGAGRARAPPTQCAAAVLRQTRPRRRQRHPARCVAGRIGPDGGGVPAHPTRPVASTTSPPTPARHRT